MVKLKLTTWAEERIKDGSQSLTQLDPEVHAAFTTGYVDFGDNSEAKYTKDGKSIHMLIKNDRGNDLVITYARRTWQLYNPPKKRKVNNG